MIPWSPAPWSSSSSTAALISSDCGVSSFCIVKLFKSKSGKVLEKVEKFENFQKKVILNRIQLISLLAKLKKKIVRTSVPNKKIVKTLQNIQNLKKCLVEESKLFILRCMPVY